MIKIKLLLLSVTGSLLLTIPLHGQKTDNKNVTVPGKGRFMTELHLLPGSERIIDINNFQAKYFLSDRLALRAGFEWDRKKNSSSDKNYTPIVGVIELSESSSLWGINLGAEYRLLPNSKISPYLGFEFAYSKQNSHGEYLDVDNISSWNDEEVVTETSINGIWRSKIDHYQTNPGGYTYWSTNNYLNPSFSSYKAHLLLGADFFIIKNFYFGLEVNFGLRSLSSPGITINEVQTVKEQGQPDRTIKSEEFYSGGQITELGFSARSGIRIGVWF